MKKLLFLLLLVLSNTGKAQLLYNAHLTNYQYPFQVYYLQLPQKPGEQQLQMAYMDIGSEKANGQVVLLLHGKNFCGTYWEQTAKSLSALGYRVIIPDQLGFGKSCKPVHDPYSFVTMSKETKMLLDVLNIKNVIVMGHSMGGMLAMRFALMYPETTTRLVLEDPIGLEDYSKEVPAISVKKLYKEELQKRYPDFKKYAEENYFHNMWKPEYNKWVEIPSGWANGPEYPRIAMSSAELTKMIYNQPVIYEADGLKMQVLLIYGSLDRVAIGKDRATEEQSVQMGNYPKLATDFADRVKTCTVVEIEGTGHIPHIENPEKFMNAVKPFIGAAPQYLGFNYLENHRAVNLNSLP